jgi:hypothetical protein
VRREYQIHLRSRQTSKRGFENLCVRRVKWASMHLTGESNATMPRLYTRHSERLDEKQHLQATKTTNELTLVNCRRRKQCEASRDAQYHRVNALTLSSVDIVKAGESCPCNICLHGRTETRGLENELGKTWFASIVCWQCKIQVRHLL